MSSRQAGLNAPLTMAGLMLGARMIAPVILPVSLFGAAVGAVAAQKGLTLTELNVMNLFVYAGAAQLVALGFWQESWNAAAILNIALITATINARLFLMSAALRPWFQHASAKVAYPALLTMTDAGYVLGQRYYAEGGRDMGIFLGSGLVLWTTWMIAPIPGFLLGSLTRDARAFGIDLVMPVFFSAMVARLWQGRGDTIAWIAAGLAGYLIQRQFGGSVHVVIGAMVGLVVAAMLTPPTAASGEGKA